MVLPRLSLRGAGALVPLQQGDLSRLCGLYALLNACRLALYPARVSRPQAQSLYDLGLEHLTRTRRLQAILRNGMNEKVWLGLSKPILDRISDTHGVKLKLAPALIPRSTVHRQRALECLAKHVRLGVPVIAILGGALDHYTVICGTSPHRLTLFDSSGLSWVNVNSVGLGEASLRQHYLLPQSTWALRHHPLAPCYG